MNPESKRSLLAARDIVVKSNSDKDRRDASGSFRVLVAELAKTSGDQVELLCVLADSDDRPLNAADCGHMIALLDLNID